MIQMEQFDPKAAVKENDAVTGARLLEDLRLPRSVAPKATELNPREEARAIADFFDPGQLGENELMRERITKGARRLESDLKSLNKDMAKYTELLDEVRIALKKIDAEQTLYNVELKTDDFDRGTGTYKNASIWMNADTWGQELFHVVQPGNTFSRIVSDSYDAAQKEQAEQGRDPLPFSKQDYMNRVLETNSLKNPGDITVGQVLDMRFR